MTAFVGSSCGADTPSVGSAEKTFQGILAGPRAAALRLAEFRKTDGQPREVFGVRAYVLDFHAAMAAQEDVDVDVLRDRIVTGDNRVYSTQVFMGDRIKIVGQIGYVRKESGWVVDSINLSSHEIDAADRAAGHSPENSARLLAEHQDQERGIERQRQERAARIFARVQENLRTAQAQLEQRQYKSALDACEMALREAPDNREAIALRDRIQRTMDILGVAK